MPGTEVYILGQKYTIKGDSPEGHIRELAGLIDLKIKEVYKANPGMTSTQAFIVTLFNIADELYKLKDEQEDIAKHIEEKTKVLTGLFDGDFR